jgi:hypothetical protein
MIKFNKPANLNGAELLDELGRRWNRIRQE